MEKAIRKLFNLYPGEVKRTAPFLILGFLWALGGFGALTLSEGMFLEHVGAHQLPVSYFMTALGMTLLSSLFIPALNRLSIPILLLSVLGAAIGCNVFLYFLLSSPSEGQWIWFLFKVIGWIIPVAINICFWAFIDQYYDLQAAKRCFCLINAVICLGDACGGGLISFTLDYLGTTGLLSIFILSLSASIPLIFIIIKKEKTILEGHDASQPSNRQPLTLKQIIKIIRSSPFTLGLMVFYFLMQLIVITTEYSYMDTFTTSFAKNGTHSLAEFLGTLTMWVSLANMCFGLFFYSRIVQKMGIANIILIVPFFFVALFIAWSSHTALWMALVALIAREGMTYTFDDNNLLLLISGVPQKIKNQVRVAIDSFFEPIGMLFSAGLLFIFQSKSHVLGLVLSLCGLGFVLFLRSQYPKAIFQNLLSHAIRFEKQALQWLTSLPKKEKRRVEFYLLTQLKKGDEAAQLLSFSSLLKMGNPKLLARLLNQMNHFSVRGKLQAIELMSESVFSKETIVLERLERWRKLLPHPSIKSAIHFYFVKFNLLAPERVLQDLDHDHLGVRGSAILALKNSTLSPAVSLLAQEKLEKLLHSADTHEICMGLEILGLEKKPENLVELFPYLKHPVLPVMRAAATAISLCASHEWKHYTPLIITHLTTLTDLHVRLSCLKALEKMYDPTHLKELVLAASQLLPPEQKSVEHLILNSGKQSPLPLLDLLRNEKAHLRSRLLAGKIIGKLSPPDLREHLFPLLNVEIENAFFYYYHHHILPKNETYLDFSLLENALLTCFRSSLDFIIQLLGIANSLEDPLILSQALASKNPKMKAHAHETLEKTCSPRFFAKLKLLIDDKYAHQRLEVFLKSGSTPSSLGSLLDKLEESSSMACRIVAISFKEKLHLQSTKLLKTPSSEFLHPSTQR